MILNGMVNEAKNMAASAQKLDLAFFGGRSKDKQTKTLGFRELLFTLVASIN